MHYLDWLEHLVAFDTTSRRSNLELIHFVQEKLLNAGVEVRLTYAPHEPKANLFATLPSTDEKREGGLILSGHTDVVPIDGQKWETPPFQSIRIGDKIFGRGTCDMKGFLAVCLSLVPDFFNMKLRKPLHLALSYDEEIGCLGAPLMITDFLSEGIKPDACLVGEPTGMKPIVAHKGRSAFRCRIHGKAAHSSLTTLGCNALEHAAQGIGYMRSLADHYRNNGPYDPFFDVPFTTFSTNLIQGGNAENTVPAFCEFYFEFRNLPEDDPDPITQQINTYLFNELLPKLREETSDAGIELDTLCAVPAFKASEQAILTKISRQISKEQRLLKVSYGTEAGQFQSATIPSLICGPGFIEQAHRPNEFVTLDQLEKCREFLLQLVSRFSAN